MAEKQGEEMTPEERLTYLRDRGVMVETAEERRIKEIRNIMKEPDEIINDDNNIQQNQQMNQEEISFVHIPTDDSIPMRELKFKVNSNDVAKGDLLLDYLKPFFSAMSKKVDLSLLQDQATKQFGTEGAPSVSQEALNKVAQQGQVESFTLVHPIPSNKFTGVNLYLDEVGMLKRLPRNKRGSDIALQAGFNPAPQFYGDLFIGRVKTKPTIKNANFNLGQDTSPDAEWLKRATMENLEYQTEMNRITGKNDQVQASIDGEDGIAKLEQGGLYSWTQTDEEIEVIVSVGIPSSMKEENDTATSSQQPLTIKEVKAGGLKVKFLSRKITVMFQGKELLDMKLYASIDSCMGTWTLEYDEKKGTSVVITCEKIDEVSWPRITE